MRLKVCWQLIQHSCMLLQDILHILRVEASYQTLC